MEKKSLAVFAVVVVVVMQIIGFLYYDRIPSWTASTHVNSNFAVERGPGEVCRDLFSKVQRTYQEPSVNTWQTVIPKSTYVYSVYTDPRPENTTLIRIIGISNEKLSMECLIWLPGTKDAYAYPATFMRLAERDTKLKDCFYICEIPNGSIPLIPGIRISLSERHCKVPTNMLSLHVNTPKETYSRQFHSCLGGPIKEKFDKVGLFIQWMEVQAVFGGKKFTVYDYSSADALTKYMEPFIKTNVLYYFPWDLPKDIGAENWDNLWNFAQAAVINDCLYRNMYEAEYIVFTDLDELIVPRCKTCTSWANMLNILTEKQCPNQTHYSFRNVFFGHNNSRPIPPNFTTPDPKYQFAWLSIMDTVRVTEFWKHPSRSKYIVNPRGVENLFIHEMRGSWPRNRLNSTCVVDPEIAALHHYQQFRINEAKEIISDKRLYVWEDLIVNRIQSALDGNSVLLNE